MAESRLRSKYKDVIRPTLMKELGLSNIMEVPKIEKIVLNIGAKEAVSDSKFLKVATDVLEKISGQRPVRTVAKKSIASFKIREGMPIGAKVTLRKERMEHFLDKLITINLAKVRDFQGISSKLDGRGNLNIGIKEWTIFPEAEKTAGDVMSGMNITIHTTAKTDAHAFELLKMFGMPFKKSNR